MVKRLGVALAVCFVVAAAYASMASADALFLGVSNTGFTASGGAGTLSTLGNPFSITCTAVSATGNVGGNDKDTFTAAIKFTGCNANSLGNSSGVIEFSVTGELCYINKTAKEVGLYLETTKEVHLENVPLIGLLSFAAGSSDVAAVTPVNTPTHTATAKLETSGTGDQKVTSCEGLSVRKPAISVTLNEGTTKADGAISTSFTISPTTANENWTIDA